MRQLLKKITHPFLKLGLRLYYLKPRRYRYKNVYVQVHPDVFPPHLTLSTKILLDFIDVQDLNGKTLLELGCGCGIISLYAASKNAKVTATDINHTALDYLKKGVAKQQLDVEILYSDLFEQLKNRQFDYIIINPPYYPKKPATMKEQAWFCGEHFEYFQNLFPQLIAFVSASNAVLMILSEDCDIEQIKQIAAKNKLNLNLITEKKVVQEQNYIFRIVANHTEITRAAP